MITQTQVLDLFSYNPLSGSLVHRYDHGRAIAGNEVGWVDSNGYRVTKYKGATYFVHKLIWLYVYGTYPDEVDHWDGKSGNNRIKNLREVTRSQNLANANTATGVSGTKGVHLNSSGSKWRATIQHGGRRRFLGNFETIDEAKAAYLQAAEALQGEFAFHNRPFDRRI